MAKAILLGEEINFKQWRDLVSGIDSPFSERQNNKNGRAIDRQIGVYLATLYKTGGKMLAMKSSGITKTLIEDYERNDPQFEEAQAIALEYRADTIVQQIETDALMGHEEEKVLKDGTIQRRTVYETPLRVMLLKRYGKHYSDDKDKGPASDQPVGAVIVPAGVPAEDWEELYGEKAKGTYRPEIPGISESGA